MPTAIACANDAMALGVLRAAQLQGVEIPAHLSLFGFDDIPVASQVTPALSTVAVPRFELGATAVRLLLARIGDPGAAQPARTMLSAGVVLRASSAAPRADR
jgi:DNA-binding LacI/PurR family transcriptional regulator